MGHDAAPSHLQDAQRLALAYVLESGSSHDVNDDDDIERQITTSTTTSSSSSSCDHPPPSTTILQRSETSNQRQKNPNLQAGRDMAVQLALGSDHQRDEVDGYQVYTTMREQRLREKLAMAENGGRMSANSNTTQQQQLRRTQKLPERNSASSSLAPPRFSYHARETLSHCSVGSAASPDDAQNNSQEQEAERKPGVTQQSGTGLGRKSRLRTSQFSGGSGDEIPPLVERIGPMVATPQEDNNNDLEERNGKRRSPTGASHQRRSLEASVCQESGDGLDRKGRLRTSTTAPGSGNRVYVTQESGDGLDRKRRHRTSNVSQPAGDLAASTPTAEDGRHRTSTINRLRHSEFVTEENGDGLERKGRRRSSRTSQPSHPTASTTVGTMRTSKTAPTVTQEGGDGLERKGRQRRSTTRSSQSSTVASVEFPSSTATSETLEDDELLPESAHVERGLAHQKSKMSSNRSAFCIEGELVDDDNMKAKVRDEIRHEVLREMDTNVVVAKVLDDRPRARRRCCMFFCTVLVAVAVVVGVVLGTSSTPNEPLAPIEAPTLSPTAAPTSMPTFDAEGRLFQLLDEPFDIDLGNSTSDAGRAVEWLLSDDVNGTLRFLNDPATPDWQIVQLFVLTKFFFSTDGLPSAREKLVERSNFLISEDVCSWNNGDSMGIFCNSDGHVNKLLFSSLSLSEGCLPTDFGLLISLQELWLASNACTGTIPTTLGVLTNLEALSLERNDFTGTVPTEIGRLSQLSGFLFLADNRLSGTIPTEMGNLSGLQGLHMHRNSFSGSLPSELGNFRKIEKVQLFSNKLTGSVPSEYGGMIRLQEINLVANMLTGTFPIDLVSNSRSLQSIRLSNNEFSGHLPTTEFTVGGSSLEELVVGDNSFDGELPSELGLLTKLEVLDVSRNNFSGVVPSEVFDLSDLDELYLEGNFLLSGDLDALFCSATTGSSSSSSSLLSVVVDCCVADGDNPLICSCCECAGEGMQDLCV